MIELEKKTYIKVAIIFLISLILLWTFSAVYFGYDAHSSVIRADQWRFLRIYLAPIYNGTFEFRDLWCDEHPNAFKAVIFILNAKLFDLSISLFFYVGIISKVLFIYLFVYLLNTTLTSVTMLNRALISLIFVSIYFSIKTINEYTLPLIT
ncbi:hypothetical protein KKB80_09620, partial [bacterium]|nr:hypothetical protein [bacterium]